jgi:hypothetical protein
MFGHQLILIAYQDSCFNNPSIAYAEDEEDEEPLVLLAGQKIAPRTPLVSRFVGRLTSLSLSDPSDLLLLSEEESSPSDSSLVNIDCC